MLITMITCHQLSIFYLYWQTASCIHLAAGYLIPKGSNLTCYARDGQYTGSSGGLCIPNVVPNITTFCSVVNQSATLQASVFFFSRQTFSIDRQSSQSRGCKHEIV